MSIEEEILTPELRGQRTLAAIVFTDVVSFSMLMATNEEHTLDLLRRDFQIMKELCQRFEGKVIKTIGDALLMYFASAVKAVACAQEIQSSLAEITANLASDDILTHRIGIHLGDVFFNGTDVLGDGVNIAARLQAEAQPGGICLSQTVYEVVKNPLALKATDLVPRKLKNMPDSVSVYQIPPLHPTPFTAQWELDTSHTGQEASSNDSKSVIYSSGQWVLLHDHFFQLETYSQNSQGKLTIQIPSKSIEDNAALQSLRLSIEKSPPLKFAYQNDGLLVKVKSAEAIPREDYQIWTLTLEPQNIKHEGSTFDQSSKGRKPVHSADEIAELRVKRLLLNDPPKVAVLRDAQMFSPASAERERLESLIRGSGTLIAIEDCVLQTLYPKYKDKPRVFRELARLEAIFFLKAAGVVEQVIELSLGPIDQGKVHVRFRGRRRNAHLGMEPVAIEIEGDCPLVSEV